MNSTALALAGFTFLAIAMQRKPRRKRRHLEIVQARHRHGIRLTREKIEIASWDAWLKYAPDKFVEAVQGGVEYPEHILAHLFREMFPALKWPPPDDSPYAEQWARLVDTVEQNLPNTAANGDMPLRIV